MERPLWDRIQQIYHSTLPIVHSERYEFLTRACGDDTVLVSRVNSLLEAHDSSDGFLETPVFEIALKVLSTTRLYTDHVNPVPKDDLIGKTIDGRYLIELELGQGGMGKVYLALDLTLHNRPVVVKVLSAASLTNPYVLTKFKQEVEALSRINHPGVVSVLDTGELSDGKPYLAMQYVDGVTLRSQLTNEGMELHRAAAILREIGAALEHVHDKQIYHRDLKPENIMLQSLRGGRDLVKVVDFGIAKVKNSVIAPSTVNEMPVGTVLYMSPEQLRGESITATSDIYSMGIIAFEMLTGRRPFNPVSAPQLLEMHRDGVRVRPVDLRTNLPIEAQAIVLRSLAFEPSERYQNAAEFCDALAESLVKEAIQPSQSSGELSKRFEERRTFTDGTSKETKEPLEVIASKVPVQNQNAKLFKVAGIALGVIVLLSGILLIYKYKSWISNNGTSTESHGFKYWLTVQKMRDSKPYQEQYQSSGQGSFENGYKFRLNISSTDSGYLYLFNDGTPTSDGTFFTVLYPTPATNGVAAVGSNQVVQTNWNTFAGEAGTENFWIVWSTIPVQELEAAKLEAFKSKDGALSANTATTVKNFLKLKQPESKIRTTNNTDSQFANVRGTGDPLVKLVRLEHR